MRPLVVPFFISHLGCPERCVFCNQEKIAGARGRLPSPAELLERIASYRAGAPGRDAEVAFFGGSFSALPFEDQQALLGPVQPLLASGEVSSLRISTRPDAIDAANVAFLKEMGVRTVELGVQSMNDEILRLSRRGHTVSDCERAVALLKQARLEVGVQLMPGLPGDSEDASLSSLEKVLALAPSFLRIYPTLVVDGTELAERFRAGSYRPLSLERAVSLCKRMLVAARRAGVPVIRLGLQASEELESPGTILAGPYHPAFGQLVQSEICFDALGPLLSGIPEGSEATLLAPVGRTSDLVGQGRRNLKRIEEHLGIRIARVRENAALAPDEIAVEWSGGTRCGKI